MSTVGVPRNWNEYVDTGYHIPSTVSQDLPPLNKEREGYRVKEIEDTGRIIEWNVENVAAVGKENWFFTKASRKKLHIRFPIKENFWKFSVNVRKIVKKMLLDHLPFSG